MASLAKFRLILSILLSVLPLNSLARTPHSCYWGVNKLAPDDFLPCYGSSTTSQYSCCQAGDKCLEGNACYDSNTGVTYQYGCTDSTHNDPHCPQKCNLDTTKSHWVGLIFCNGSNKTPNDTWVCHHPDNCGNRGTCSSQNWGNTIQRQPPTGCEDVKHGEEYVALETIGMIRDLVSLPVSSMTASWWSTNADRYRTVVTASIATPMPIPTTLTTLISTGSSATATKSSLTSTAPSPSASTPPQSEPSNPDARRRRRRCLRLGLGIGVPLTTIFLLFLLYFLFKKDVRFGKKRANQSGKKQESGKPIERPTKLTAWDWLKNAVHPLWWHFDDIPCELREQRKETSRAIKTSLPNAWDQLWQDCTETIDTLKGKLSKQHNEEDETPAAAASHEPKPDLDTSPVPESPASSAASDASSLPTRVPLHVTNGGCASPTITVESRPVGVLTGLRLHEGGVVAWVWNTAKGWIPSKTSGRGSR